MVEPLLETLLPPPAVWEVYVAKAALSFCSARRDLTSGFAHCVRVSMATFAGIDATCGPDNESDTDNGAFVSPGAVAC